MQTIQAQVELPNIQLPLAVETDQNLIIVSDGSPIIREQSADYQQQSYRWIIIILASLSFAINNMANNAIIPIASKVATVYDLSSTYANLPIQLSFLINPIVNFTAGHFMDTKGLGVSFRIGSILYAVGLLGFCLINYGYHFVLIGSIFISVGQPLITNSPAKLATFWFISENRTLATGIISAINIVTLGAAIVLPTIFVDEKSVGDQAKDQIFSLYSKYFLASCANAVLIMFFMKGQPERLPSAGAEQQKTHIFETFKIIKADRNLWKFFAASMLLYGTFLSFASTSNMLFKPYGFDDSLIAIFGICLLVSGIIGSVCYTLFIKKTQRYKVAIVCAVSLAVAFTASAAFIMNFSASEKALISVMCVGMGFNLIPMVPISYDVGCQLTFPVGQAQVVGIITGGSMIYTVVLTLSISAAVGFGSPLQSAINMIVYISLFLLGAIFYALVDIVLKRKTHQAESKLKKAAILDENNLILIQDGTKDAQSLLFLNTKSSKTDSQKLITIDQEVYIKPFEQSTSLPTYGDSESPTNSPTKLIQNYKKLSIKTKQKGLQKNENDKRPQIEIDDNIVQTI